MRHRGRLAFLAFLPALYLAVSAAPASAYTVERIEFSTGASLIQLNGTSADETIVLEDQGDGKIRFTGNTAATVGPGGGCAASGNDATCGADTTSIVIRAQGGSDSITARSVPPQAALTLEGGEGDDSLTAEDFGAPASTFATSLQGQAGDDVLVGSPGRDTMAGGADDDVVSGNAANDRIDGGLGGDVMAGGAGTGDEATYLVNGFSTPRTRGITVQAGDSVCNDGSSDDTAVGSRPRPPANVVTTCGSSSGVERDDVQGSVEKIIGTDGPDNIIGSAADETITGLGGTDQLEGGGGIDTLDGAGNLPGATPPNDDDLLLMRDGLTDNGGVCGGGTGDRAVADPPDPVDPSCENVERGGAGVTGPGNGFIPPPGGSFGGEPTPEQPVAPEAQPIQPSPTTPGAPPTGNETGGTGPGGGDDGETAPELKIFGETLLIDEKRRAQARITCVYRAKECKGTAVLSPAKTLKSGKLKIKKSESVGDAKISIPWGRTGDVPIKVSKDLVKFLEKKGSAKLKLSVAARDSGAGKNAKVAKAQRKLATELADD